MPKVIEPTRRFFLGIDPGKTGSASLITDRSELVEAVPFSKLTETEIALWFRKITSGVERAALELVRAMPGQGVSSMFKFGWSYGFLRGLLAANQIPFIEPMPQAWMKGLGISSNKKSGNKNQDRIERKRLLLRKAQERWPKHAAKITLEVCDSILIAEYLRLQEVGNGTKN